MLVVFQFATAEPYFILLNHDSDSLSRDEITAALRILDKDLFGNAGPVTGKIVELRQHANQLSGVIFRSKWSGGSRIEHLVWYNQDSGVSKEVVKLMESIFAS